MNRTIPHLIFARVLSFLPSSAGFRVVASPLGCAGDAIEDPYHIRVGDTIYDIRTGSSDNGIGVAGTSRGGLEAVRQALVTAVCSGLTKPTYPT
jgi:hypothetical protein